MCALTGASPYGDFRYEHLQDAPIMLVLALLPASAASVHASIAVRGGVLAFVGSSETFAFGVLWFCL